MKTIFDHIEHVKGKPHHIRKQVAFATAGGGAALIAFVWLAGNLYTGSFAIKPTTFADATGGTPVITVDSSGARTGLAGAAAALPSANAPAHIEIVDTTSRAEKGKQAEQTTIPF